MYFPFHFEPRTGLIVASVVVVLGAIDLLVTITRTIAKAAAPEPAG